jgi:hypothetical protein
MTCVTIIRRRDPLEGQRVGVLRRWRRKHGRVDLLVVLPNGRKRLVCCPVVPLRNCVRCVLTQFPEQETRAVCQDVDGPRWPSS